MLTFAANQTTSDSQTFNIDPHQDLLAEGSETIVLGATVTGHTVTAATFTITDDDERPNQVTLSFSEVAEEAGATNSTVTVKLANSAAHKPQNVVLAHDVTVTLSLGTAGTATSGTDYTGLPANLPTVTIAAGEVSGTVDLAITPTDDDDIEGDETIAFTATAATGVDRLQPRRERRRPGHRRRRRSHRADLDHSGLHHVEQPVPNRAEVQDGRDWHHRHGGLDRYSRWRGPLHLGQDPGGDVQRLRGPGQRLSGRSGG